MIQVQVEVESGAGRFLVSVRAESIGRALSLASAGESGATARVVFPIEPEPFFVGKAPDGEHAVVCGSVGEPVESAA